MIKIPCNIEEAFQILEWLEKSNYNCPSDYDLHYDSHTFTFEITCTSVKLETLLYLKFG